MSVTADSTPKKGEHIRQTDERQSRFIDESCSLRFNLLTDSTEIKLRDIDSLAQRVSDDAVWVRDFRRWMKSCPGLF